MQVKAVAGAASVQVSIAFVSVRAGMPAYFPVRLPGHEQFSRLAAGMPRGSVATSRRSVPAGAQLEAETANLDPLCRRQAIYVRCVRSQESQLIAS